jgi:hypothetical protein
VQFARTGAGRTGANPLTASRDANATGIETILFDLIISKWFPHRIAIADRGLGQGFSACSIDHAESHVAADRE